MTLKAEPRADLTLKKYVMFVDSGGGPLSALIPRLRELNFRIITVPALADAQEMLRAFPKLSLVAINEHLDPAGARELLATMRQGTPDLPILWHGKAEGLGQSRSEIVLSEQPQAEEMKAYADGALGLTGYPADMVSFLIESALAALGGFGTHCCARDPFIKASRVELAELSALISFSGPRSSGHLIVGAAREVARRAYSRAVPRDAEPTDEDLADLLGEVCNRIIGPFMGYLGHRAAEVGFSLPLFIAGEAAQLWEGTRRPSLGLELEGAFGPIFVELSGEGLCRPRPSVQLPRDLLQSGEFILL